MNKNRQDKYQAYNVRFNELTSITKSETHLKKRGLRFSGLSTVVTVYLARQSGSSMRLSMFKNMLKQ